jgi:N-acetylneuraminate synthase/pseudaminic acid synthase
MKQKEIKLLRNIQIGKRKIGPDEPCFVVAEMSGNHDGSIDKAKQIIHAARESGADAVKFQAYLPDTITLDSDSEDFRIPSKSPWEDYKTLYAFYEKAHTPWAWFNELFEECRSIGLEAFSSVFDPTSVDFLENIDCPVYKIAGPEITDIPLLEKVAHTNKPVIVSTGLATLSDLDLAVQTLKQNGSQGIILVKCTTAYPTPPEEVNLRTIPNLAETFQCHVGLSDHTLGIGVPIASVCLGAKAIEKHFVLDRREKSVDDFFSLEPEEFRQMVNEVRKVEKALGMVNYDLTPAAQEHQNGRRSLYVFADISKGERFTVNNVRSVRPAFGLHPKHLDSILGKRAIRDLSSGDRLSWDVIDMEGNGE